MEKNTSYYNEFWAQVGEDKKSEIRFDVDGEEYSIERSSELKQLCEDESYMQGFTLNSEGNIIAVELNRITWK